MGSYLELSPSVKLRIGIAGFGGFGQFLRQSWSGLDEAEVVAVADPNPNVHAPGLTSYRDWRALLIDPGVDLISVATPPAMHADAACEALAAGKHVLVEKPLATTLADARRIIDAQASSGRVAAVNYMLRFNPIVETLQRWARAGTFGRLRHVSVENYAQDESLPPSHWFWDHALSGGILVEHAVHFIDMVHASGASAPTWVDGIALQREDGLIDRMGFTARYPGDLVVTQMHDFSRPGIFESTDLRFVFDLAQVEVNGWIPLRGRISALASPASIAELEHFPGAATLHRTPISKAADDSRPAGWGGDVRRPRDIRSGGRPYAVDQHVRLDFELATDKSATYADCLRAMMRDLAGAVADPDRQPRVALSDGLRSLEVALRATGDAIERLERMTTPS